MGKNFKNLFKKTSRSCNYVARHNFRWLYMDRTSSCEWRFWMGWRQGMISKISPISASIFYHYNNNYYYLMFQNANSQGFIRFSLFNIDPWTALHMFWSHFLLRIGVYCNSNRGRKLMRTSLRNYQVTTSVPNSSFYTFILPVSFKTRQISTGPKQFVFLACYRIVKTFYQ